MHYYEVHIADIKYRGNKPLTYSFSDELSVSTAVTIPLRGRNVTGFIASKVQKPSFAVKPISRPLSKVPLPGHLIKTAQWLSIYYATSLGESLRQFTPNRPIVRKSSLKSAKAVPLKDMLDLSPVPKLTADQKQALNFITSKPSGTILLHGNTGSGKTEVYLRAAKKTLSDNRSVIILTPEIALTSQLAAYFAEALQLTPILFHSHLSAAQRKKTWIQILENPKPQLIIGARSALFTPVKDLGLIIVDEAHEPAYKQSQSPRYHAVRVASQLGILTGAKVILGSATPDIVDYFVAEQKQSIVKMTLLPIALSSKATHKTTTEVVDLTDKNQLSRDPHLSDILLNAIKQTLREKRQSLVYLNRRGTARVIICQNCGWQFECPNCSVGMVYHGDRHLAICHSCGLVAPPPKNCPECDSHDIVYKVIGTKAVADSLQRLFPQSEVVRFDSDNKADERIEANYKAIRSGSADIIVGTQLLAKGFDLPELGMVGVVLADTSLFLPDYKADERTYQLLTQVLGRIGRGHGASRAVIQTYNPANPAILAAMDQDWGKFYQQELAERRKYGYPPYSFVAQLICRRSTHSGAERAAERLANKLRIDTTGVQVIGPSPAFREKQHGRYNWHIILKSRSRQTLVDVIGDIPADWTADLDPINLL